jgi:hypothetical protein
MAKLPLGARLIQNGVITQDQLEQALKHQKKQLKEASASTLARYWFR